MLPVLVLSCSFLAPASAQQVGGGWLLHYRFTGPGAGDSLGSAACMAGDLNGDGYADVGVSARGASPGGLTAAGSVYAYSGKDGGLLYRFDGQSAGDHLGASVGAAGDINGDGFDDLIFGTPDVVKGTKTEAGVVLVASGRDGRILFRYDGTEQKEQAGWSVAGGADFDGDGFDDFLFGALHAPNPATGDKAGRVLVISGATKQPIHLLHGPADHSHFGAALAVMDDLDGDGVAEFIVGISALNGPAGEHQGAVRVYSGATATVLHEWLGVRKHGHFGNTVAAPGDVNGDGKADVMASAPRTDLPGGVEKAGAVRVFSGADGSLLHQILGSEPFQSMGATLAGAGDVDRDGCADFAIGAHLADSQSVVDCGSVFVHSGRTGDLLQRIDGIQTEELLGSALAGNADVNGDGHPDLVIGQAGADSAGQFNSGAAVVCGFHPFLTADAPGLSAAGGGTLGFTIDFPSSEAGLSYALLASATGTGPTFYHGIQVPLTQDVLFHRTAAGSYPNLLAGGMGVLNAWGRASATLSAAPGQLSGYVGSRYWVAAVSFATPSSLRLSSVAASFEIWP